MKDGRWGLQPWISSSGNVLGSGHLQESDLILRIERKGGNQIEGAALQIGLQKLRTGFSQAKNQGSCRGKLHTYCIHIFSIYSLISLLQSVIFIILGKIASILHLAKSNDQNSVLIN